MPPWYDTYLPLPSGHFRLLSFHPAGSKSDPLECSLHPANLQDCSNTYKALSYEWGPPDDIGSTIHITNFSHHRPLQRNLEAALRKIRLPNEPLALWIDALCINQADLQEKSHQVTLMGSIFKHAHSVIAWIGTAHDESDIAMDLITPENIRRFKQSAETKSLTQSQIRALIKLAHRPYWSRVWIVQELFLASDFEVRCGTKSTNRDTWYDFLACMNLGHQFTEFSQPQVPRNPADIHRMGYDVPSANTLAIWMKRCLNAGFHATNPRDYVYALLGVANDVKPGDIVPDYEESEASLRRAFTQAARVTQKTSPGPAFGSRASYLRLAARIGVKLDGDQF